MTLEVIITRRGDCHLFADGQPVHVNPDRLRDWVEERTPRPYPPRFELSAEQLEDLRLYVHTL
jgi:hypothetical protein